MKLLGPVAARLSAVGLTAASLASTIVLAPAATTATLSEVKVRTLCRLSDDRLSEISGMGLSLRHPGILWVHNDSSGGPFLYAVDTRTCDVQARLRVEGMEARDLEAMAVARDAKGRAVIWLADIGDNRSTWESVRVHRIREPKVLENSSVEAQTFDIRFPDRPHDAEALLVAPDSSAMWIVTKQLARGRLYELPMPLSTTSVNTARFVQKERGLVTDGAMSPDGARYVLRDYVDATTFTGTPPGLQGQVIPLPFQVQGEAIAWTSDSDGWLVASERDRRIQLVVPAESVATRTAEPTATPVAAPSQESAPTEKAASTSTAVAESNTTWPAIIVLAVAAVAVLVIAEWRRRVS